VKNLPVLLIALLVIGGICAAVWVWNEPGDAPTFSRNSGGASANAPAETPGEDSPAGRAEAKMGELKSAKERIAHLDWLAAQSWATSNSPLLRKTIVSDPDEGVQIKAVEVALQLAAKEGTGASSPVVKIALASNKGNTRARGLKAARENPDANLVPTLLELVDNKDPYTTMALNALAYSNDERGKARITALARDTNADPQARARAVALIAVTRDAEGHRYLVELSNGDDEALRKLASEVLRGWNG